MSNLCNNGIPQEKNSLWSRLRRPSQKPKINSNVIFPFGDNMVLSGEWRKSSTRISDTKTVPCEILELPFEEENIRSFFYRAVVVVRYPKNTIMYLEFGDDIPERREIMRMPNNMWTFYSRVYMDAVYDIYNNLRESWGDRK